MQTLAVAVILILWVLPGISPQAYAQSPVEVGTPLITSWLPEEYGGQAQIWSIEKDNRGVMYFGNDLGILEYDGVSWRLIESANKERCASLKKGPDGRIYAGCIANFGYLAPDSTGTIQLVSLLDRVPEDKRDFGDIWILQSSGNELYFSTKYLFRWTPTNTIETSPHPTGELKIWDLGNTAAGNVYHGGYASDNTFYIRKLNEGLMRLQGDTLAVVPDGERFAEDRIYVMLPYDDDGRTLVGARNQGLFIYDGQIFSPFSTEADNHLQQHDLYMPGAALEQGWMLNTLSGGAVLLNKEGKLLHTLDQRTGLIDNTVISVFADPAAPEAQWLALNTGIARVEAMGPFTTFGEERGLTSTVNKIHRHNGQLYVATTVGVSWLNPYSGMFEPVEMPLSETWELTSIGDYLLAATDNGIFVIDGARSSYLRKSLETKAWESFVIHPSRKDTLRVFVGVKYGISVLELVDDTWQDVGRIPGFEDEILTIAETDDGTIWAGTRSNGILRITFAQSEDNLLKDVQVVRFGQEHDLPEGGLSVFEVNDELYITSREGFYRYETEKQGFSSDPSFALPGKEMLIQEGASNLWGVGNGMALGMRQNDGSYSWLHAPFERFSTTLINTAYVEDHGITWFGTTDGLIRYDSKMSLTYDADFPALIRTVVIREDSLIYGGAGMASDSKLRLDHEDHDIQFTYAATSYENVKLLRFQSRLDGYDDQWSNLSERTERVYTNLSEGNYQFRVRAVNGFGHISQEAIYNFVIAPPWFRSWWAYTGYVVLAGLFLFGASRVQQQRLLARAHEKAQQREAELHLKNELEIKRIEAASLKELDDVRSRFFANISHELRTPLTLILGQIESLKSEITGEGHSQKLDMASRNASRLQQLVNQLLDVAKLEAGKMPLRARQVNIVPFLKRLFVSFESLAEQKQFGMRFYAADETLNVYVEPEKMEKVFINLLSNAIKFTPDGGDISVHIHQRDIEGQSTVEIEVRDSGIGIPEEQLPFIFDRFFQVESGKTRDYEGTGIGLSLAKELTELHGGTLSVTSKEGLGTVFTLRLLVGRKHLNDDQIVSQETAYRDDGPNLVEPSTSHDATGVLNGKDENTERPLVLIVEDNLDMRTYIRQVLDRDYEICEAGNGKLGFELAREHIPDLIISDVMMPALDGYQLSQKIREDELTSHIPIVMLTARVAEAEKLEGLESGVDAYLTKPFSTRELLVRVRKLIELRQMLQEQQNHPFKITSSEVTVKSIDEAFIERLQHIVEDNLADEQFQVDSLCREIGVSERQLYRKLKALLNCTPAAYIRMIRLDRAKQLLEKKAGTVSEITFQVGYGNTSAFARAFREAYGKAPSDILKSDS